MAPEINRPRATIRHGRVHAVIEVTDRTVQVHVEGTAVDVPSATLLQALSGQRPPWLTAAAAVQTALDADPGADPAAVLDLVVAAPVDKRALIDSRRASTAQWVALTHDRERPIRSRVARATAHPHLPECARLALLADAEPEVRRQAVKALRHRPDLIASRTEDPDVRVRLAVARHRSAPEAALRALARDAQPGVRAAVAARSALPLPLMRSLAADPEVGVRGQVAVHARLPQDLLLALAADPRAEVRRRITLRRRLPVDLLLALATDRSAAVQGDLLTRHSTQPLPPQVLSLLAQSVHRFVRRRALTLTGGSPQ